MGQRMLASDLDGTLLTPEATVSERTAAALAAAREAGMIVCLVTGRPPRWLGPIVEQTGWHGLAVSANGAVLVDLDRRIVEQTFPISDDDLHTAIGRIRELLPGVLFAAEKVAVGSAMPSAAHQQRQPGELPAFGQEPGFVTRLGVAPDTPEAPIEELIAGGDVVKLLARTPAAAGEDPDAVLDMLQTELAGVVNPTHSMANGVLLEISRVGISKASGVAWLAQKHGIDQVDVIAVGDMPNDLPMLLWAGEGWAMENAHAAVLAAVGEDRILPSHSEDGVAQLLERLLEAHIAEKPLWIKKNL